ncbi:MAG: PorV/PorQ family protein [Ignavibacteria bacterium]|nr:PorV/PorQ family protein [Ignavibacteria bacterium]
MKKLIYSLVIIFLITSYLNAQNPNLGTSGAQFLQIPIGAKAIGVGNAFIGLSNDASSIFWNPAGILGVNSNGAHFTYMKWFEFFDVSSASYVYNAGEIGTFGASLLVLSMDKMEITTEISPNGTGRFFDAQDLAVGITYARNLTDRFRVGITAKYIHQRIWNETADGVAFDIGTQYRIDFNNLTIAMSMTNFGPDLKMSGEDLNIKYDKTSSLPLNRLAPGKLETEAYPLPLHFQVGVRMDLYNSEFMKVKGEIDASHPNDNKERLHFGAEFSFFDRIFLRGGYKYNYSDEKFAFGAGVNLPFGETLLNFDYAYAVHDILPSVHIVTLGFEF